MYQQKYNEFLLINTFFTTNFVLQKNTPTAYKTIRVSFCRIITSLSPSFSSIFPLTSVPLLLSPGLPESHHVSVHKVLLLRFHIRHNGEFLTMSGIRLVFPVISMRLMYRPRKSHRHRSYLRTVPKILRYILFSLSSPSVRLRCQALLQ